MMRTPRSGRRPRSGPTARWWWRIARVACFCWEKAETVTPGWPSAFLHTLRSWLRRRAHAESAQGLVEYSLMMVCVAFVSLAGFHVISNAQQEYFTDLPVNPPPP